MKAELTISQISKRIDETFSQSFPSHSCSRGAYLPDFGRTYASLYQLLQCLNDSSPMRVNKLPSDQAISSPSTSQSQTVCHQPKQPIPCTCSEQQSSTQRMSRLKPDFKASARIQANLPSFPRSSKISSAILTITSSTYHRQITKSLPSSIPLEQS